MEEVIIYFETIMIPYQIILTSHITKFY